MNGGGTLKVVGDVILVEDKLPGYFSSLFLTQKQM
jgi:hypothetical protein